MSKTKVTKVSELLTLLKNDNSIDGERIKNLEHHIDIYESIIDFSQIITRSIDYRKVVKMASNKIREILFCENVLIYRFDEINNELFYEISNHIIKVKVDENTFVGSSASNLATLFVKDTELDIRTKKEPAIHRNYKFKNLLITPLVSHGKLLGCICAINKRNAGVFSEDDVYFIETVAKQFTITVENTILFEEQQKQFLQICEAMADAIGKKDKYTGGHTKRVSKFSEMIASELNLPFSELSDLRLASVLHDVGKIGIEDKILKKSSPLDDEEFKEMRNHPKYGFEILGHIESLKNVISGMMYHHERPDGKGYPYGLSGDSIPLIAQIISVADTFDAMISTRPYRKGLQPMVAFNEILKYSGTQFSDVVVDAFAKAFRKTRMYHEEDDKFLETNIKKAS